MRFIFEYKPMNDAIRDKGLDKVRLNTLRKMMATFENMVNTVFTAMRVHLSEEEDNDN